MRRTKPEERYVPPDIRYGNVYVQMFIHHIMSRGKKSTAVTVMYDALDLIKDKTGRHPVEVFEQALRNVGPLMEVRPRRVGGATYQVPMEVSMERRMALAMRWLADAARARSGKSFEEKLSAEFMDAANGQGNAVRKREETHRMADANRAFSHYRM